MHDVIDFRCVVFAAARRHEGVRTVDQDGLGFTAAGAFWHRRRVPRLSGGTPAVCGANNLPRVRQAERNPDFGAFPTLAAQEFNLPYV